MYTTLMQEDQARLDPYGCHTQALSGLELLSAIAKGRLCLSNCLMSFRAVFADLMQLELRSDALDFSTRFCTHHRSSLIKDEMVRVTCTIFVWPLGKSLCRIPPFREHNMCVAKRVNDIFCRFFLLKETAVAETCPFAHMHLLLTAIMQRMRSTAPHLCTHTTSFAAAGARDCSALPASTKVLINCI